MDRVTCPRFIGDDGQNIVGRELTPSSFVTANVSTPCMATTVIVCFIYFYLKLIPAGITRQDAAYLVR